MGIVAIGTLHKTFFHLVMERHVELGLGVGMALEAELWLGDLEQVLFVLARVHAVTANAAYICFTVSGTLEVCVLALVATQATGVYFFRGSFGGIEDLGNVTAIIHVSLAGPVAVLACDAVLAMRQRKLAVRVRSESLVYFLMAGCAGLGSDEIRGNYVLRLRTGRLSTGRWGCQGNGAKKCSA